MRGDGLEQPGERKNGDNGRKTKKESSDVTARYVQ